MDSQAFRDTLLKLMEHRLITVNELSSRTGTDIGEVLSSKTLPSPDVLSSLCSTLGVSIKELVPLDQQLTDDQVELLQILSNTPKKRASDSSPAALSESTGRLDLRSIIDDLLCLMLGGYLVPTKFVLSPKAKNLVKYYDEAS